MDYKAAENILSSAIYGLPYDVMFGSGREADFNQMKDRKYPLVWLDPMTRNASNPDGFDNTESYDVSMVFLVKGDKTDTAGIQTTHVDFAHQIAKDFIAKLDESEAMEFNTKPQIRPLHRTTFGTDHTSGCILTFTMVVFDTYTC